MVELVPGHWQDVIVLQHEHPFILKFQGTQKDVRSFKDVHGKTLYISACIELQTYVGVYRDVHNTNSVQGT